MWIELLVSLEDGLKKPKALNWDTILNSGGFCKVLWSEEIFNF